MKIKGLNERASGPGTPLEVLNQRITKGHDHFQPGYTPRVIDVQGNRLASQGAEEFFMQGYLEQGAKLRNIDPSLSFDNAERIEKSLSKMDAFYQDLFGRQNAK